MDILQDNLSADSITSPLSTRFIGRRVLYYPCLDSTMDAARQEAEQGAPEGTIIVAGEQSAGRGRLKRSWLSPAGNIAISIILYPNVSHLPQLVMLASLAVADTIEAITSLKTQIKWPNDVLVNGKKVCGILTTSLVSENRVVYAIVGIGINISLKTTDSPEISTTATSINAELGKNVSRVEVIRRLLVEMERLYLILPQGDAIFQAWRARLVTLGKKVCVASGGALLEGKAESVDKSGALLLRHYDGTSSIVIAGDVTLRYK